LWRGEGRTKKNLAQEREKKKKKKGGESGGAWLFQQGEWPYGGGRKENLPKKREGKGVAKRHCYFRRGKREGKNRRVWKIWPEIASLWTTAREGKRSAGGGGGKKFSSFNALARPWRDGGGEKGG